MGKYLERFKQKVSNADKKIAEMSKERPQQPKDTKAVDNWSDAPGGDMFDDYNDPYSSQNGLNSNAYDEVNIPPAQKPESFHHFILENQYKDLERSIRGFKDVYNKDSQSWEIKRKQEHCFTDEEAEEILRTAQSHLATDIKLGFVSKEAFPLLMDAIYKEIAFLFESVAEYRYGRYGQEDKQYQMKLQNHKIFLELFTRIQANYSRSIQGSENKATHGSVRGQESLQGDSFRRDEFGHKGRWS